MEFLCMDIMNSSWSDHLGRKTEDRLNSTSWLVSLLDRYECPIDEKVAAELIDELKELRGIMKEISFRLINGEGVIKDMLLHLNSFLARTAHTYKVEQQIDEIVLVRVPTERGKDMVLEQVALSFAKLLTEQDWRRIKICKNPDCRWIFYDESKNRNKCWCESKTCGNLMKVRNYRERKKLEG